MSAEILGQLQLFSGLSQSHLERLNSIVTTEKHAAGAEIFKEGDAGDKFYVMADGAVRIARVMGGMGEETLAILRAGSGFGEMSLFEDVPRSAHAIVHEDCTVMVIRKRDLEDLLFVDRDLAYELLWRFVRVLSTRLRNTNDKMTMLSITMKF